ncbi:MAG TPA: hypothetical protein VHQ02_11170 [Usitatibacter sp.]|jgi:hypothetical protein|nr:hypothetical protein [Usitatibacter sp.]
MPLDLLVPDLLAPADAPAGLRDLRLPALEKWLARADVARSAAVGADRWLAERFALLPSPPMAAIALAGEDAPRAGEWLRADPVHLRIDGDSLVLHDASVLALGLEDARALVAALQAHFAPDGLHFHAMAPDRWYVEVPEGERPATVPLEEARGRNAFGLLPSGRGRINWPSALTEAQMVLSTHEVNQRREAAGEPPVNSVWFWGEGRAPGGIERRYDEIHADAPFPRGLGRLSGAAVRRRPESIGEVDLLPATQSALVVLDPLSAPMHRVAIDEWRAAADAMDERWFRELGTTIERFGTVRLILPRSGDTLVATLGPAARRRWLRRARPLATHA